MRCDRCPLCPTAEDDVCAIAESELGIEHKDGMMGCRHSWNWCKKKADEYADYLGRMGREMGMMWDSEQKGFKDGVKFIIDKIEDIISDIESSCIDHSENEYGEWETITVDYSKWADVFIGLNRLKEERKKEEHEI